jgi:hypothetical protein
MVKDPLVLGCLAPFIRFKEKNPRHTVTILGEDGKDSGKDTIFWENLVYLTFWINLNLLDTID